jgi:hypothetical protein
MKKADDPFALENLRLVQVPRTPPKIAKRRQHFIMVPFDWLERLKGAGGQIWHVALHLQYLHWKGKGKPITLANGMLEYDGINRRTKWWALAELEQRGLISIERRKGKSPLIRMIT